MFDDSLIINISMLTLFYWKYNFSDHLNTSVSSKNSGTSVCYF